MKNKRDETSPILMYKEYLSHIEEINEMLKIYTDGSSNPLTGRAGADITAHFKKTINSQSRV